MAQASPTMRTVLALIVVSALSWVQIQASPTAAAAVGEVSLLLRLTDGRVTDTTIPQIERNAATKKSYGAADLMGNALDETTPSITIRCLHLSCL